MLEPLTWETYCEWRRTKCPKRDLSDPVQRDEEITQATLELIGEVAEINSLVRQKGNWLYSHKCPELINECGDVIFCACWVMDSWGFNDMVIHSDFRIPDDYRSDRSIDELISSSAINSGLLANFLKKQKYQGKKQNPYSMSYIARDIIFYIMNILETVDSSAEEALRFNIAKLEKRFPRGHTPDGGVRE